jgi:hypothetical protein
MRWTREIARWLNFAIAAVFLLLLNTLVGPAAVAHDGGWRADGSGHVWCFGDSTAGQLQLKNAMRYGMTNLDAQTDIQASEVACNSATDVPFGIGAAIGARGQWSCITWLNGTVCGKSRIIMNPTVIANDGGPYDLNLHKSACHESGHSVGLNHHDPPYGDCMVSGSVNTGHQRYNYDHYIFVNNNYL